MAISKRYLRLLNDSTQKNFRREILHFWYLLCIFSGYVPELEMCTECGKMFLPKSSECSSP